MKRKFILLFGTLLLIYSIVPPRLQLRQSRSFLRRRKMSRWKSSSMKTEGLILR